jgi:hypothetical protein
MQNVERKAVFTGEEVGLSENGERKIIRRLAKVRVSHGQFPTL